MLVKIVYAPGCSKYITNAKDIHFISDSSENAKVWDLAGVDETANNLFIDDEFLHAGIGASLIGNKDDKAYISEVCVDGTSYFYTGTAYLCDDTGKTVDTLR